MRAAAAWSLAVLALGAAASQAGTADGNTPLSDSLLVRVDADATRGERAEVGRALDAESARNLVSGWRVYGLSEPMTLDEARERLADADAAQDVQVDARVEPFETPNDPSYLVQWPLPMIDAPSGWNVATPTSPVTVAVIDTGVDTSHPELSSRLWRNPGEIAGNGVDDDRNGYVDDVHGWNFADWTAQTYAAADGDSHGTHVAGVIAARRNNGAGIAGIADNGRIMVLKFLKPGGGYTSDAIVAIQYAVAKGAKVINASWGGSGYSQALCDAISQAGAAGVVFVAAAGNSGTDNDAAPVWPANCPASSLISVAATTQDDGLASFSNRGAMQVDVGAPGKDVYSTIPGGYGYKSGTSMAAPQVSGIAAAVIGARPGMAAWQTKAALTAGGDPDPALVGTTVSGRRVDLLGSLTLSASGIGADATPPDPFSAISPAEGFTTTTGSLTFRWNPAADAQSGVAAYRLVVDGVTVAQVAPGQTEATPATAIGEGVHQWSVVAVDGTGNQRTTPPRALLIDRTAPSATAAVSPADAAQPKGPEVAFVWAPASDAVSGVAGYQVLVDGGAVATVGAGARSVQVRVALGRHTWQVRATDAAGNASDGAARSFAVTGLATALRARVRPLRLSAPPRIASGTRPLVRLQLTRAARVTLSVRRATSARPLAAFTRRWRAGSRNVVLPNAFARRLRPAGVYLIVARAPGGLTDTVRIRVR